MEGEMEGDTDAVTLVLCDGLRLPERESEELADGVPLTDAEVDAEELVDGDARELRVIFVTDARTEVDAEGL